MALSAATAGAALVGFVVLIVLCPGPVLETRDDAVASRPSAVWYFAKRPQPADFVIPEEAIACAVASVTAIGRVRTIERRWGGPVARDVELRIDEDIPALALTRSQVLRAEFHLLAPPGLPKAVRDEADQSHVDSLGALSSRVGESTFVMLCRQAHAHVVTYAVTTGRNAG